MAISLRYWASYTEGRVKLQRRSENSVSSDHVLNITGVVQASMRNVAYKVTIELDDDTVKRSTCECVMRDYYCHHVAAVLLFGYKNVSKTDIRCSWLKRPKSQPKKIETIDEMYPSPNPTYSTIIPEHHSCCGYRGYDNRTQLCTDNYKVINRTKNKDCANTSKSCYNEFSAKRRRVSHSICNTCFWRFRRIYTEIKSGNQNVCKRHTYNITIDNTTDRDIIWILDAKYEIKDKMESYVKIIIPCKSEKLNKTGDYLLVTDSTIDGETLRLGDSDLLIQRHPKLVGLVEKKQSRCRQVSVVLGEIHRAVRKLIRKFLGIK
eukprot:XP_019927212.1 PREDICTED: uncharacterized protein LOC105338828 [Crassostrea gigas]